LTSTKRICHARIVVQISLEAFLVDLAGLCILGEKLVVKKPEKGIPIDFTLFQYWKENNLMSFKSKPDALELSDIYDSHIYFYGYLNMTKSASFENTTMNLLVNTHPRAFLKKYSAFCKEIEPGVWEINSNFYKVYLIEIHFPI
jgi:hypothetical protein